MQLQLSIKYALSNTHFELCWAGSGRIKSRRQTVYAIKPRTKTYGSVWERTNRLYPRLTSIIVDQHVCMYTLYALAYDTARQSFDT